MSPGKPGRWLVAGACLVVVATLVVAISMLGTPAAQRDLRMDQRRIDDLDRIVGTTERYLRANKALPPTLAALAAQPGLRLSTSDPVGGAPYVYEVTGGRSIRLCADFATDTATRADEEAPRAKDEWLHGAGRQCFDRTLEDKRESD